MKIYKFKDFSNRSYDLCKGPKPKNNTFFKITNDDDTMCSFFCYSSVEELTINSSELEPNQRLANIKDYCLFYQMENLELVLDSEQMHNEYPELLI